MPAPTPFVFVASNAVQEIKHRIFLIRGVPRRCIDDRLAFVPDRFGIILDRFHLPVLDPFARFVEIFRRIWKCRFVVGTKHYRTAKTSASATARRTIAGAAAT